MDLPVIFVMLFKQLDQFERCSIGGIDSAATCNRTNGSAGKYNQYVFHSMMFGWINYLKNTALK
jgi:hypothetical protein